MISSKEINQIINKNIIDNEIKYEYSLYTGKLLYYHPEVHRGVMDGDPEEYEFDMPDAEQFKYEVVIGLTYEVAKQRGIDFDSLKKEEQEDMMAKVEKVIERYINFPTDEEIMSYYNSRNTQPPYELEPCETW